MKDQLTNNVFKTALLFEGGSMRASYSSAVAVRLLEEGVYFNSVYGISAGSSNAVNYVSRDCIRARESFTGFIGDPRLGNLRTMLQHKGYLNAHWIYQEAGLSDGVLPFDFDAFSANPANLTIFSLDRDTGENLYFTRADMPTINDLMLCVRASSTLPFFMPPPTVKGRVCYDGGFAIGGGLPIEKVDADGFDHMVIVRTRPRGFRREGTNNWAKLLFWRRPEMKRAVLERYQKYNEACDLLDLWEKQGRAYVFYCDDITVSGTERDVDLLTRNHEAGYAQIQREWADLMKFIERAES